MADQAFVCGCWFWLYLIFKDGSSVLCIVFSVSGRMYSKTFTDVINLDFTLGELP